MRKKRWLIVMSALILLIGFILALPFTRSLAVMSVYSALEKQDSVLSAEGITLYLPGGLSTPEKDWYPLVITFNADNFGAYAGCDVDLTILYNFGAFDSAYGCSSFYDPASDYHDAFYGAYIIKSGDGSVYGYANNGTLNIEAMAKVFEYDMNILVLKSLGCASPEFAYSIISTSETTIDRYSFDVVNAEIYSQSPLHSVSNFKNAYYQYGSPKQLITQKDFKNLTVYGRIYASELPEKGIALCFYIIAPSEEILDACEKAMIKKAKISTK